MRRCALLLAFGLVLPGAPARADAPAGAIRGTVRFAGDPPPPPAPGRNTDPVCAGAARLADQVAVAGGKLAGVMVRIAIGGAGKHAAPAEPVVIEQSGCAYSPRVVGILAGQKLLIRNADPTLHNVHAYRGADTEFNLAQPRGARPLERTLDTAGDVVALKCDAHPWMRAWAVILDHPFFAVTGADGAFALSGVPPGKYTVEAWHPLLGLRSAPVTVAAGKTAELTFTFTR